MHLMITKLLRSLSKRNPQDFPSDENGDILFRIWKRGADLSTLRTVDFSLIFPTKEQADRFATKLKLEEAEVDIKVSYFEAKTCWDVRFSPRLIPSWRNITEMEERLARSSEAFDGRNDGWGFFSS